MELCPGVPGCPETDVAAELFGGHACSGIDYAADKPPVPGRDVAVIYGDAVDQILMDEGSLWVSRNRVNSILIVSQRVNKTIQTDTIDGIVVLISTSAGDGNQWRQYLSGVLRGALLLADLNPWQDGDSFSEAAVLFGKLVKGVTRKFRLAGDLIFGLPDYCHLIQGRNVFTGVFD